MYYFVLTDRPQLGFFLEGGGGGIQIHTINNFKKMILIAPPPIKVRQIRYWMMAYNSSLSTQIIVISKIAIILCLRCESMQHIN